MRDTFMKCGHTANATKKTDDGDIPVCLVCAGITPDAEIVADDLPDLTGRTARCNHFGQRVRHGKTCKGQAPSRIDLAFFEHTPGKPYDVFYCGCWGWD